LFTGYNQHIGDSVQQQLSELTNASPSSGNTSPANNHNTNNNNTNPNGSNTAPAGPASSGGMSSGDDNGYVPQGFDQDYHSLPDPPHPAYVENSPEFYSSSLLEKGFNQSTPAYMPAKTFARSK